VAEFDGVGLGGEPVECAVFEDGGAAGVVLEVIEQVEEFGVGQGVDVEGGQCVAGGVQGLHGGGDGTGFHTSNIHSSTDRKSCIVTGETTVAEEFSPTRRA
jgi:hypothetical protein